MMNSPQSPAAVSSQQAADELLNRRSARRSLLDFTKFTFPQYTAEPVHELIASTLDRCVRGEIERLMIFAPPQHGKSELVSVRLPAFWLGNRPDDPIVLASYAASLAESKSRQARQVVEDEDFGKLFPEVKTQQSSRSVEHWTLDGFRGGMKAVGVGGPITGHGAMLGIIDDPFENWAQAQSKTIRDKTWEWWRTTFRTRVWERGCIILIMTRWHEDDLAGRLLAEQAARWTVIRLPALSETQEIRDKRNIRIGLPAGQGDPLGRDPDEPLAPRRFSKDALDDLKSDVGELAWNAEYQGAPTAPEGNRFKRHWFEIVQASQNKAQRIRYWDKAGTEDGGAYSTGLLMAKADDGIYYIEDVARGQWSSNQRNIIMKQTAEMDAEKHGNTVHIWHEQEGGSGGKESAEITNKLLAGYPVHAETVTGSKDVRLEPFAAQSEAGNIRLVRGAWNAAYIEEMCAIPNGTYRDQGDASSGAFNKLARRGKVGAGWL